MTKTFPGVIANDQVNLTVQPGEIHALLGENGAGKSTLVKMIYGILKPDSGQLLWKGESVEIVNPAMARQLGIAMVFQHFSLFDSLSVTENIALGMENPGDINLLKQRIVDVSNRYGLPLDPDRHVYTLSVGERQRIEIIRCLLQQPQMLVMDEPTSVLTPQEVEKLFETLKRLASEGVAIVYISHKLDEIKAICETATILRGGKVVDTSQVAGESARSLAAKMMGEELAVAEDRRNQQVGEPRLEVNNLNLEAEDEFSIALKNIDITVCRGEIVGIAGVAGNGQDELLKALNGESLGREHDAIKIDQTACGLSGVSLRRSLGMASIPEERLGHGAVPNMSLNENAIISAFKRLGILSRGFLNHKKSRGYCDQIIDRFNVKCNGHQSTAASLSGGNLQKFIVGREILLNPDILVVSQPTWGVDAGAAHTIHEALRNLADEGAAILVISQDLDELMRISDRIGAICAGALSETYPTSQMTIEQIGLMMAGVNPQQSEAMNHA